MYMTVIAALDHVGRTLWGPDWTGDEEFRARRGLIDQIEWGRVKDLPRLRGSGAPGSAALGVPPAASNGLSSNSTAEDPSSPSYQAEYNARERYDKARDRLRALLEAGEVEAALLDPWTGILHELPPSFWRRSNADRVIERKRAALPGSQNTGELLVKRFGESARPLPVAKMTQVIEALKQKSVTESLTRAQQKEFVHRTFPHYRFTDPQ
jgi:hypothetical protein